MINISNNIVAGNLTNMGIHCRESNSVLVENNLITSNGTYGIYFSGILHGIVNRCIISGHESGIRTWYTERLQLSNSLVYRQRVSPISLETGTENVIIVGMTCVDNHSNNVQALRLINSTVLNSIIYNSNPNIGVVIYGSPRIDYSNVLNGYIGIGNIDTAPGFVGSVCWGIIESYRYDRDEYVSILNISPHLLTHYHLDNQIIEIDSEIFVVKSNTRETITVWGDISLGRANFLPLPWSINSFHLKASSPMRNAGIGPDRHSLVPNDDIDQDTRSGEWTDIGFDQYNNATSPQTRYWGALRIHSGVIANISYTSFEKGEGVKIYSENHNINNCEFLHHKDSGFHAPKGSLNSTIYSSTAAYNLKDGFYAPETRLIDSCSKYNNENGMAGSSVIRCYAYGNKGNGILASSIQQSESVFNKGSGIICTGPVYNCFALDNRGNGIEAWTHPVRNSTSAYNSQYGIIGSIENCETHFNGIAGVSGSVKNSRILNNHGLGVEGVLARNSSGIFQCPFMRDSLPIVPEPSSA